jgi:flagellar basal-body rod protein FlgG
MSTDGEMIEFEGNFNATDLSVGALGELSYVLGDSTVEDLGITIAIGQFKNPAGLEAVGGNYYKTTSGSGEVTLEADDKNMEKSMFTQGTIESSNVQVVEEMVKMIVAQRAYEMNSKSIQTSDEMLSLVNQLKR